MSFQESKDYKPIPPFRIRGNIVHGFKRGSTQLGFPTANVAPSAFAELLKNAEQGVYFGWAQVLPYNHVELAAEQARLCPDEQLKPVDCGVYKCMLSLGKNVQFDATQDTLEVYIHHEFQNTFYEHIIEVIICGYIRPQLTFNGLDELIAAIKRDVEVGEYALTAHPELAQLAQDDFFTTCPHANKD